MKLPRRLSLLPTAVAIVALCYAVAAPARSRSVSKPETSPATSLPVDRIELERRCQFATEEFKKRGEATWSVRVIPPFILAGDFSEAELARLYDETVAPTAQALQLDYFDRDPDLPIVVLILSSDDSYRQVLKRFGQAARAEYAGLYQRDERTILVNLSTGAGTLAHELTHALAHADFPEMPEWFDEGLASLHEDSEFSADGRHLLGNDNWRSQFLHEAEDRDCWKSISELCEQPFGEPQIAALDYALARSLCLFLQDRGVLPAFYRKCRGRRDATGESTLLRLFPGKNMADIDQEFRAWLRERKTDPARASQ